MENSTKSNAKSALWWDSPLAHYVLSREQALFDAATPDIFGYNALQIGLPQHHTMAESRIANRWTLDYEPPAALIADPHALPFPDDSLDLITMPHALEFTDDPHEILREAQRVLRAEGSLIVTGFNPLSLWGLRRRFSTRNAAPWNSRFIGGYRVKDWLSLLGFDIVGGAFSVYIPPCARETWQRRFGWLEKAGDRWWPIAGGVYFLHAVKKVFGMRVVTPVWKRVKRRENWAAAHRAMDN
jgi:SAM-dependent methyltransferase